MLHNNVALKQTKKATVPLRAWIVERGQGRFALQSVRPAVLDPGQG